MDDIYDVSDNENINTGPGVGQHNNDEVVGEEAMRDDEPMIILSHTDTREYAALMRLREALPANHDDIFNNIPAEDISTSHDHFFLDRIPSLTRWHRSFRECR